MLRLQYILLTTVPLLAIIFSFDKLPSTLGLALFLSYYPYHVLVTYYRINRYRSVSFWKLMIPFKRFEYFKALYIYP